MITPDTIEADYQRRWRNMDLKAYPGLPDILHYQAGLTPDRVALIAQDQPITYAELALEADRIASALAARGVVAGDHVGLLARNSPTFLTVLFGIMRAGAIATPLNWRLAPTEIAWMVEDAQIKLAFTDDKCAPLLSAACSDLSLERVHIDHRADFEAWLAEGAGRVPNPPRDVEHVVLQMYTSGTTGRPKGAMLCNRNFEKFAGLDCGRFPEWWSIDATDIGIAALPLFHIGGLESVFRILFNGAKVVLLHEFDPKLLLAAIARYRPTIVSLVPTMLQMVLNHPDCAETDLSSIERLLYGASPITLGLLQEAIATMPARYVQAYGMTETCSTIAALPPHVHTSEGTPQMRAAGMPLTDVEIRAARPDGSTADPLEVGELFIRGRVVMKGYWNNEAATAEAIDAEGWFHSGDAGYIDESGFVYVHDRLKDMIISGAENIYPAEVENAIFGHPDVSEVAVVGVPHEKWGETVVGVVTLKPDVRLDEAGIIAWARERVAGYKAPHRIVELDALPKNAAGKVLKSELRRRLADLPKH